MDNKKAEIKNNQNKTDELNEYKNNRPFYLMTLETNNGECKQIKIYKNSDPFELAYNFCKDNNLDFESMKYVKKNIKEIVKKFNEDDHYMTIGEEYYDDEYEDEYKKRINFKEGKNNKNKKSANELICSLLKKNIKLNQFKINRKAPLQKKINEDIKKIYKFKKNEIFSRDYSKKNKEKEIFKNNNYHLAKNKIIYKSNKNFRRNELKNKRYKLCEKNLSNDNIKINKFSYQNNSCAYGVPELKNNKNINMVKKIENFPKNNKINIKPIDEIEEIESSRKFKDEDNNEEDKEYKKKETIDIKELNNKEKGNKFNCFQLNKMINNINNNNNYNHNYHIIHNNSINISNNNIFNNINPINYNNENQFHYISSKDSIEDASNSKSSGKMKKISNRTSMEIENDKFKDKIGFNTKAKIMKFCKKIKKKKEKNIISVDNRKSSERNYSKEIIKTLLNDYKNSLSKNKRIKQIILNKNNKISKFRDLSSSEDNFKIKSHFNNISLKKVFRYNTLKAENLKYDSGIFNQEEIAKSFRRSTNNNIYHFINLKKEIKPIVGLTHISKNIKRKNIKKNLVYNLPINAKKCNNSSKLRLKSGSSHKTIKTNNSTSNLHLISHRTFRSNFIEFNKIQKNNKSVNDSLNISKASKYKNTTYFPDIKYINNSFSNNSKIKKDKEQQILYNALSDMFIFFLNEKSKLVDTSKSLSKIVKIFSPEIKKIYIKMLDYFNNYKNGKMYKKINKKTFINEMSNAYNNVLTNREKKLFQKNIRKKISKNDKIFSLENVYFKNNIKASDQFHLEKRFEAIK